MGIYAEKSGGGDQDPLRVPPINQEDYLANLKLVREFFKTERFKTSGIGYIDSARMEDTIETVDKTMGVKVNFKHSDAYTGTFLPKPPFKLPEF